MYEVIKEKVEKVIGEKFDINKLRNYACLIARYNKQLLIEIDEILIDKIPDIKEKTLSEKFYIIYNDIECVPICHVCNKNKLKFAGIYKDGYYKVCSNKCATLNPDRQEKSRQTCVVKYGVDNAQKDSSVRNKSKETCLEKYGTESPLQCYEIKEKIRQVKSDNFINNIIPNRYENFTPMFIQNEYEGVRHKLPFKCNVCNTIKYIHVGDKRISSICNVCNPPLSGTSSIEIEIFEFIKQYFPNAVCGNRSILKGKEIDILIPGINIGIEYDSFYYHSELSGEKDRSYHLNKTKLAWENGTQLIHIFEDEWINKQEIVKSILKNKLGICDRKLFARKCEIRVTHKYRQFLNDNHIQGYCPSRYNIGLYYENELVSLLSISASRFNKNYEYELTRFCNKLNTVVVGGFSRLLKYFIGKYNPKSIVTYADARWSTGELYKKNGFGQIDKKLIPDYHYIINGHTERYNRMSFQKKNLTKLLENFDESLTEWENMQLNGYDRIWDCGNYVFVMNIDK